jgi:hypothetical protein
MWVHGEQPELLRVELRFVMQNLQMNEQIMLQHLIIQTPLAPIHAVFGGLLQVYHPRNRNNINIVKQISGGGRIWH